MKKRLVSVMFFMIAVLLAGNVMVTAGLGGGDERPYIGVRLDSRPLDELLVKHLRLKPNQGLVVKNIQVDSPADKANLECDDIIIGFGGKDVTDYDDFVSDIRQSGVGDEVNLEIIHLGERKTVNLTLAAATEVIEWKYPMEPDYMERWQPGRMFRLEPDKKHWQQMPFDDLPDTRIKKYIEDTFKQRYVYSYLSDDQNYEVEINGDPHSNDATVTVRIDRNEYKATVDQIDKLPGKYRKAAQNALENARKDSEKLVDPDDMSGPPPDEPWGHDFFDRPFLQRSPGREFGLPGDLHEQMREMMERMQEMEQRNRDLFERFERKTDETNPDSDKIEL
jgi:hypothetical protein